MEMGVYRHQWSMTTRLIINLVVSVQVTALVLAATLVIPDSTKWTGFGVNFAILCGNQEIF